MPGGDRPVRAKLRAQLLAVFARLEALHECDDGKPLRVTFHRDGEEVVWTFSAEEIAAYLPVESNPLDQLNDDERAILKRLSAEPVTGKDIAGCLRMAFSGSFRTMLAPDSRLRRLGLVELVEGEGYVRTELAESLLSRMSG